MRFSAQISDIRLPHASSATRQMFYAAKEAMKKSSMYFATPDRICEDARKTLTKEADFGANQNPQFEKVFGTIAFTYLTEKVPGLVPHVVGFQLLDRDDNGRKAIGVFVAQIGERIIDIPMFFINGELKGHQLMRMRHPDMFLPLREAFLDYLLSKLPQDLGETGPGLSAPSPLRSTPDIMPFTGSRLLKAGQDKSSRCWEGYEPVPGKEPYSPGSCQPKSQDKKKKAGLNHIHDWAWDLELPNQYAYLRTNKTALEDTIALLNKDANHKLFDLSKLLGSNLELLKTAAQLADYYPAFRERMATRYGEQWLQNAATSIKTAFDKSKQLRAPQRVSSSLRLKHASEYQTPELEFRKHPLQSRSTLVTKVATDDQELEEWNRYGELAIDRRPLDKLAAAYRVEAQDVKLQPPLDPGTYTVFLHDGSKKKLVVVPAKNRYPHSKFDLVIDFKDKKVALAYRNSYICHTGVEEVTKDPVLADLVKANATRPKEGELFLVVNDRGEAAGPFLCTTKVNKAVYSVEDMASSHSLRTTLQDNLGHGELINCYVDSMITEVHIDDTLDNASMRRVQSRLIVGTRAKFATLKSGSSTIDSGGMGCGCRVFNLGELRLKLMSPSMVGLDQLHKFANLEVRPSKSYVTINGVQHKHSSARRYLMVDCHLSKEAAEDILTDSGLFSRYFLTKPGVEIDPLNVQKSAAYPGPATPEFPTFQEPYTSESGRYVVDESQEQTSEAMPMPRREPLQPWESPQEGAEPQSLNEQDQMNMIGSPDELFDVAGLVSLVRNSRVDTQLKQVTKSLVQTIDRLGRILFMYYAHQDEFENRYGENDMLDLESALISVFEGAGDLFITLSRRSNDPQPELDIMDLPVEM